MKSILVKSSAGSTVNYMDYSKKVRFCFLFIFLFFSSSLMAQSLKDSLFGGKLKADTSKTYVSKDTGKYVAPKVYNPSGTVQGETKKNEVAKLDDASMPDSLNKNFYAKQKTWKRFIDVNTTIISQEAVDTKKVRKGQYTMDVEYTIGLNGKISTTNVTCNPPNEYLVQQVTDLMKRAPTLSPPVYSDGKPRPLNATQTITIVKK
ncbi:MAG: hypothetical protein ACHQF0_02475 [Chitinophagales bacterium]